MLVGCLSGTFNFVMVVKLYILRKRDRKAFELHMCESYTYSQTGEDVVVLAREFSVDCITKESSLNSDITDNFSVIVSEPIVACGNGLWCIGYGLFTIKDAEMVIQTENDVYGLL